MPTVLIIDDSETVREQVRYTLAAAGYDVLEAGDGLAGAEAIEQNTELALVVCDINMPALDGLEVLARVRDRLVTLPVMMLTTEGDPELIRRAKLLGAKGWLTKPFRDEILVAAVNRLAA